MTSNKVPNKWYRYLVVDSSAFIIVVQHIVTLLNLSQIGQIRNLVTKLNYGLVKFQ